MKKLTLSILLLLMTQNSFAGMHNGFDSSEPGTPMEVKYISWCENNKLMGFDKDDNIELKRDCTQEGLSCRARMYYLTAGQAYFAGACSVVNK